jgi:outer membrane receptor for ferrienterochelin and colicins
METEMKKTPASLFAPLLIACGIGCVSPAHAQSVDYGSLQSLFGEPITTSATGTPQRASEVPADMTIITADQIRQSGSRSVPQIVGMYVPGMDVLQTSSNSFDVGVRGYQQPYQPRLLVLVDGRQVFLDDYSRTIWDNIPVNIDDIRQIEVVKGTSSALFGSNAAGGVINIITYSPFYDDNKVATIGFGTQNRAMGDATVTGKFGSMGGIKISGGGMVGDEFSSENSPFDAPALGPSHRYVSESSLFQAMPDLQFFSELTYSNSVDNPAFPFFYREGEDATSYSLRGGLSWQTPYGLIKNNNYFNRTLTQFSSPNALTGVNEFNFSNDLIVSQLEDQFKIGSDHTFRAALEYRHRLFSDMGLAQALPQSPEFNQDMYAASGTWLWQINDQWSWTNAVRVDHQDSRQTGTLFTNALYTNADYSHALNTWSGNSGLVYKATDMDAFRATYGRGVQLPGLISAGYNETLSEGGGVFVDEEGNPHLKPTIVQDYELAYDRKVPEIFSTATFSVYYELNQDVIGFLNSTMTRTPGPVLVTAQSTNIGDSRGLGGEIDLKGAHPSGFRWDASYSYARVYDSHGVETAYNYQGSTPVSHFRLSGGYTTGPWEFDANGQYLSSTDMLRTNSALSTFAPVFIGPYASLGGRIGYKITDQFTLAVSGTNINSSQIQESPYPAIQRQALVTLTGKF